MTDNDIKKLYDTTLQKANISELSQIQSVKFLEACKRIFIDNPDNGFNEHIAAARIYLNYILSFPDLTLPPEQTKLP
jgi:hypothetical protein